PQGCAEAHCVGNACLGVVCSSPPAATCTSASQLHGFTAQGTCEGGTCGYASFDVSCPCEAGQCKTNPCAGVSCTQPPPSRCLDTSRVRVFDDIGTCAATNGACTYASKDTACGPGGCASGQCQADPCAGVTCNAPPASSCVNSTTAQTYARTGRCAK